MTHPQPHLQTWLEGFVARHAAVAGTLHIRRGEALHLSAAVRIPQQVARATQTIPRGKGMAGLAWERERAVQTCNLQDDSSGDVRPGAKAVDARSAVALPIFDHHGEVRAVVGVAWMHSQEIDKETLVRITQDASVAPYAD